MRRFTNKQQHFVSEYVENRGNATQDALVSYKTSYPSARVIGSENLTKPNIRREIDFLMHKADLRVEDALQTIRDAVLTATTSPGST